MKTTEFITSVAADRSLTDDQKNLIAQYIPQHLIATTVTAADKTQLLVDADKFKALKK